MALLNQMLKMKQADLPSTCFPATIDAMVLIVLFVSVAGAYNPLAYCGIAAVYADVNGSAICPARVYVMRMKINIDCGKK